MNLTNARALLALSTMDVESGLVRIGLGPLVGWVFYFGFSQRAIADGQQNPVLHLIPFIAGFSTDFLVGLLNKIIQTAKSTLSIGDAPPPRGRSSRSRGSAGSINRS
jgi:hypothetical protein